MNKIIIKSAILLTVIAILIPVMSISQEKKVHIKKVKEVDGKKEVYDTIFVIKDGDHSPDILKEMKWVTTSDSSATYTFDVEVESDDEGEVETKVIVVAEGDKYTVNTESDSKHKVKVITLGEDEHEITFFDDFDIDLDQEAIEEIRIKMERSGKDLDDIRINLDTEKIILLEELEGLKELEKLEMLEGLEELHELKELKNIEFRIPDYDKSGHNVWVHNYALGGNASEKELRDAGINVKADRLDIDDYNINIDNGVVDINFSIAGDSSPKITVYNFYGEKVYSGKPVLMNGKYESKIDLSKKQHGTYYLQIVNKNSSVTKKLKL